MVAYLICEVRDADLSAASIYQPKAAEAIAAHGGRYLVRGGSVMLLEGEQEPGRIVIIEFPSGGDLESFYNSEAYRDAKLLRQTTSKSRLISAAGYAPGI